MCAKSMSRASSHSHLAIFKATALILSIAIEFILFSRLQVCQLEERSLVSTWQDQGVFGRRAERTSFCLGRTAFSSASLAVRRDYSHGRSSRVGSRSPRGFLTKLYRAKVLFPL